MTMLLLSSVRSRAALGAVARRRDRWTALLPSQRQHPRLLSPHHQQQQRRSFLTDSYWLKRVKILQIVWRTLAAYPQMHDISVPEAPINALFARDTNERERTFMFVLSQVPPDEPIDLPEFLSGASHAAEAVYDALHAADHEQTDALLRVFGTPSCVETWRTKLRDQRALLGLPANASLKLERVEVQRAELVEVTYSYGDASGKSSEEEEEEEKPSTDDTEKKTSASSDKESERESVKEKEKESKKESEVSSDWAPAVSKYLMHEGMQIQVQFQVREHVAVERGDDDRSVETVDSTFRWTFTSDIARADLIDWVVTHATPFKMTLLSDDKKDAESTEST
ncbi:hypothetical protein PINS_up012766 [Pythium insidiosum]|nr:hypothetical protein PINS_up012766 [Pythium insidiosum]